MTCNLFSVCQNLSFPHAISGNPKLISSRFRLKDCRNDKNRGIFGQTLFSLVAPVITALDDLLPTCWILEKGRGIKDYKKVDHLFYRSYDSPKTAKEYS